MVDMLVNTHACRVGHRAAFECGYMKIREKNKGSVSERIAGVKSWVVEMTTIEIKNFVVQYFFLAHYKNYAVIEMKARPTRWYNKLILYVFCFLGIREREREKEIQYAHKNIFKIQLIESAKILDFHVARPVQWCFNLCQCWARKQNVENPSSFPAGERYELGVG